MTKFVLHAGISKTASSTLQQSLFLPHSQIYYLGKINKNDVRKGCRSERILEILEPLLWNHSIEIELDTLADRYRKEVLPEIEPGQIVVASWESVVSSRKKQFEAKLHRVKHVFENLEVMICLRNPLTWVPSSYLQAVQGHHVRKNREEIFGDRPYLDLDAWSNAWSNRKGGDKNWLFHAEAIRWAISLLGRENVGVFLFEDLKEDPEAYYGSIADFLGVDKSEALDSALGAHRNPRLLQAELDYIRDIDASLLRRRQWNESSPKERRQRLKEYRKQSGDSTPARATLSDSWAARISDATRESNAWLVSELGLDLEKHGYPL